MLKRIVFLLLFPFRVILFPIFIIGCFVNLMFMVVVAFLLNKDYISRYFGPRDWISSGWRGRMMCWPLFK